jgi:hypothetical protein
MREELEATVRRHGPELHVTTSLGVTSICPALPSAASEETTPHIAYAASAVRTCLLRVRVPAVCAASTHSLVGQAL